jgi:hypothetical protein
LEEHRNKKWGIGRILRSYDLSEQKTRQYLKVCALFNPARQECAGVFGNTVREKIILTWERVAEENGISSIPLWNWLLTGESGGTWSHHPSGFLTP